MKSFSFPRFWQEHWHGCQPPNKRLRAHIWKIHTRQQRSKSFFFCTHCSGASWCGMVFLAKRLKWFKAFCVWFSYIPLYLQTPKSALWALLKRGIWTFERAKGLSISTYLAYKLHMAVAICQGKGGVLSICSCCSLSGCRSLPNEAKHFFYPHGAEGLASVFSMAEQEAGNRSRLIYIYQCDRALQLFKPGTKYSAALCSGNTGEVDEFWFSICHNLQYVGFWGNTWGKRSKPCCLFCILIQSPPPWKQGSQKWCYDNAIIKFEAKD